MRKFDSTTGELIDDKRVDGAWANPEDRQPGDWRAEMLTLPLVNPVRELRAGDATYRKHPLWAAGCSVALGARIISAKGWRVR